MEVVMNEQYPLTVFFDASCGLCHNEMQNIKIHDSGQQLILVDCSAEGFDDTPYRSDGVTRAAMMECIHVRNNQGEWIKGISAFELLYRTVGMLVMAKFWGGRYTRSLMERVYPWIARNRRAITKTGLPIFFEIWSKHSARQANKRSQQCSEGRCSI
jgi:predicted DCC family thiol-disulfide oxidoreductase YuxK